MTIFNMAGLDLPNYLKGKPEEVQKEIITVVEKKEKKNFDDMTSGNDAPKGDVPQA